MSVQMSVRVKFNLVLLIIFIVTTTLSGYLSYSIQIKQARDQVLSDANLMLETALATRTYTREKLSPLLSSIVTDRFIPETVPSFSAHQVFQRLNEKYDDYSYRETVLNPTNTKNLPASWEVDIIQEFRKDDKLTKLLRERSTDRGKILHLAHPIRIDDEACLVCHSTPDRAPPSMIKVYGATNGFNWQLGETIGAQIVSVPLSLAYQQAYENVLTGLITLFGVFGVIFITINFMLHRFIIHPLIELSTISDQVSKGLLDPVHLNSDRTDELGILEASIQRLSVSLNKAMSLLKDDI